MNEPDRHWTDEEIVRWVDEKEAPRTEAREHLDRCDACRARTAAVEALLAALGAEPLRFSETKMAAQRDRILAAVASRPRTPVRRFRRPSVWVPGLAAAGIAALLLWAPGGLRSPGTSPVADLTADREPLPVVVQATRAAEEIAEAVGEAETAERLVASPSLASTMPDAAVPISEGWIETLEIEEAFAGLPAGEREAILTELASVDLTDISEE